MLYLALEKAINRVLQMDPDTLNRLASLQGKVVKLTITDWRLDCYLCIQEQGIRLTGDYSGSVDTIIRGKLLGLIRVGRSGASGPTLFEQGVEVSGDSEVGEKIRDIFRQIDVDGEEYLSRFVGDALAHEVAWRAKRVFHFGQRVLRGLGDNIREFSQVEAQYLPARAQTETFYHQVACLRDDVDRAAARLARLEKRVRSSRLQ